jgi:hypothetical protein
LCDDFLSSGISRRLSSSSSDCSNSSSVCNQQLIFNSNIFDLSIPSWGDGGKSNTIVLFPKASVSAKAAAAIAALERDELLSNISKENVHETPAQCRPLEWGKVTQLVDHRAMIAAVAMQQAR